WVCFVAVAAATVLPFVVADFWALKHWSFDLYMHYGPNTGTLSVSSYLARHFGIPPTKTLGTVFALCCALLAIWRAPRTRYAFALVGTLLVFGFFLFNIWMCMNNYFFVAGLALVAAAASMGTRERVEANGALPIAVNRSVAQLG